MLDIKNVTYKIDNKIILDNINFCVNNNEFIAITGVNGSGKSTILKAIMGLIKLDSGKILFNNENITDLEINERSNKGITYSEQTPITFKGLTVFDLMLIANKDYPTYMQMKECLKSVGLNIREYLEREISSSLSGGELKRIGLAVSLMKDGKLLMLDEPESGIDLWSFDNIVETIKDIKKTHNISIIAVTHQEKLLKEADKILILDKGKIIDYADSKNIIKNINSGKYSMESANGQ